MVYNAHIKYKDQQDYGDKISQSLKAHLINTAEYTSTNLKGINLKHTGYLAGILHDMGKYTQKFQDYLEGAARGEKVKRGSVNHTFCGVIFLFSKFYKTGEQSFENICVEVISHAIGSHHGLFDCINEDGVDGFSHRINEDRQKLCYNEAIEGFLAECKTQQEIEALFEKSVEEIKVFLTLARSNIDNMRSFYFIIGLLVRIITSALIDGDRRDTAEFMQDVSYNTQPENMTPLWERELLGLEDKLNRLPKSDSTINNLRCNISDRCKEFALGKSGIYRLTVPTGGGKTLSSLRYAVAHAKEYNKKRIFFVIPLLSVLEQNAKVIGDYLTDKEIILEHHSNVVKEGDDYNEILRYDMLCENWQSPVVITTLVQLLNSCFDGKTGSIRRFYALSDSVIVIDEVQSVPHKLLYMFNMVINFLVECCNACVVLCSATQPCFESVEYPLQYPSNADIVPYDSKAFKPFNRTKIIDKRGQYGFSIEELCDFSLEIMEQVNSLLIICNTKGEARSIYEQLKGDGGYILFHLSTSMCMKHRVETLDEINCCLQQNKRVICVSTQLVEAGVDFSFMSVIRVLAGIDNVIQAAGRCNRSGEYGSECNVYVVKLKDEKLKNLEDIQLAQNASNSVLHNVGTIGDGEISSASTIARYYKELFSMQDCKKQFDYPVQQRYNTGIFDMLSTNEQFRQSATENPSYTVNQAFKTAGGIFKVFDELTTDVIVPFDDTAKEIIANLRSEQAEYDISYIKSQLNLAKPYTVSLFDYQLKELEKNGGASLDNKLIITINPSFYDKEIGVITQAVNIF